VCSAERDEIEQKEKRPTPSMYFSNCGSVLTRRIPGIEQVTALKLSLFYSLLLVTAFVVKMMYYEFCFDSIV